MTAELTPPPPHHKVRSSRFLALVGLLVGLALGVGGTLGAHAIFGGSDVSNQSNDSSSASSSGDDTAADETDEPSYVPTTDDFSVKLSVKKRECFGTAGCNVTYRVKPDYEGAETPTGSWEVTYEVRGVTDGPLIETFTLEGDQLSFEPELDAETTGPGVKATTRITDVVEGY